MEIASYDPKKITVIVSGRIITGYASDGLVTLSKAEDSVTPTVGAQGDTAYSENANNGGTIALTLLSTSSSLPYLRELESKRKAVNVSISDANDADSFTLNQDNCRITKMPDISRQKQTGTVTVNIYVPDMVIR